MSNKEFFVVQRCWYSSPLLIQPMDYLRLFENQADAEKAAFHSAAALSRLRTGEESVRTLLLPSYPAHNKTGSSYGFVAHGSLFWVRSLIGSTNAPNLPVVPHAHVVVTEGVIGGTGNRNSRRGTETPAGRVYFGTDDAAHLMARQKCHQLTTELPQGCHSEVVTIPIGKPPELYASQRFLHDWPIQQGLIPEGYMEDESTKRHLVGVEDGTEVECPFESQQPCSKRRRFCDNSNNNNNNESFWTLPDAAAVSEDEMQTL